MTEAENLRLAARRARATADAAHRQARSNIARGLHYSAQDALAIASQQEKCAIDLDRRADELDGGRKLPWWRSLPIPSNAP